MSHDRHQLSGLDRITARSILLPLLRGRFGKKPLRSITYGSVKHFKLWLPKEPSARRGPGGARIKALDADGRPRSALR